MSSEIILSAHALLSGSLKLGYEQRLPIGAGDLKPALVRADHGSGHLFGFPVSILCGKNAHGLALKLHRGHRPGLEPVYMLEHLARRFVPIYRADALIQHRDVARLAVILRCARRSTGIDISQGLDKQLCAHVLESVEQLPGGLVFAYLRL